MYFNLFLLVGVLGALTAMVVTQSWLLLGWAAMIHIYHWLQCATPKRFDGETARNVFAESIIMQCALCIMAAVMTGFAGAYLIAAGMIANTVVVVANEGFMPILNGSSANICYTEADERTRAVWLCDLFRTTETSFGEGVVSAGDALECIGIWVLAAGILLA